MSTTPKKSSNSFDENSCKIEWLDLKELRIGSYQRSASPRHVNGIVRDYCAEAFGILIVGKRKDGTLWVVDGYARYRAALKLGLETVPCHVISSKGVSHEAGLFCQLNNHSSQRARRRQSLAVYSPDGTV